MRRSLSVKPSENLDAYLREYRQQPDQKQKSRERAKNRRKKLSNDPVFVSDRAMYAKKWREKNPDAMKKWRDQNRQKLVEAQRKRTLSAYGLTPEDYDKMLLSQNGVCAICGSEPGGRWKRLFVDHDHVTGAVRGLLCHLCNTALERVDNFRDSIDAYLEKAKK